MNTRLKEIRERHNKTTNLEVTDAYAAHKDRGELLDMLERVAEIIGMHDGGRIDEQDAYNRICEFMDYKP